MNTQDNDSRAVTAATDDKSGAPDASRGRIRQDKFRATLHLACFAPDKKDVNNG